MRNKELIEAYLEELEDSLSEQASFEDSMHGTSEDTFGSAYLNIENKIMKYEDKIDFFKLLEIPNKKKDIIINESVFDIESFIISHVNIYNFEERLKKIKGCAARRRPILKKFQG